MNIFFRLISRPTINSRKAPFCLVSVVMPPANPATAAMSTGRRDETAISNIYMVNGLSYWLRWVAVLPGALIGGLLATFPLHWVLYLAFARNGSLFGFIELPLGSNIPVEYALTPFVIAVTFILVGDKIAPTHKFQTSIILTILLVSFFIGV
ncbi:MAG: hypothetical protein UT04_C0032G0015, partial [Candidatus Daviesbacteria bacterium GW2011_GWF2_38_7]